jgi:hypothetical protein
MRRQLQKKLARQWPKKQLNRPRLLISQSKQERPLPKPKRHLQSLMNRPSNQWRLPNRRKQWRARQ